MEGRGEDGGEAGVRGGKEVEKNRVLKQRLKGPSRAKDKGQNIGTKWLDGEDRSENEGRDKWAEGRIIISLIRGISGA